MVKCVYKADMTEQQINMQNKIDRQLVYLLICTEIDEIDVDNTD